MAELRFCELAPLGSTGQSIDDRLNFNQRDMGEDFTRLLQAYSPIENRDEVMDVDGRMESTSMDDDDDAFDVREDLEHEEICFSLKRNQFSQFHRSPMKSPFKKVSIKIEDPVDVNCEGRQFYIAMTRTTFSSDQAGIKYIHPGAFSVSDPRAIVYQHSKLIPIENRILQQGRIRIEGIIFGRLRRDDLLNTSRWFIYDKNQLSCQAEIVNPRQIVAHIDLRQTLLDFRIVYQLGNEYYVVPGCRCTIEWYCESQPYRLSSLSQEAVDTEKNE